MVNSAFHYGMIGESDAMKIVYDGIDRVASSKVTVYIVGESGTGKELVAKALHMQGKRREKPFVGVSVAELGEGDLLESHLFGVKNRVATGVEQRNGLFTQAEGGTLFLDEIAEMSPQVQVKLLRAIQEHAIVPVGGDYSKPVPFDVRFVAASSRPLEDYVRKGTFRQDLYYRLRQVYLFLPALRERGDDICLLADHFLAKANQQEEKSIRFADSMYPWLLSQEWPGNIRELENTIYGAVAWSRESVLAPTDFLSYKPVVAESVSQDSFVQSIPPTMTLNQIQERIGTLSDRILGQIIQIRLASFEGNVAQTVRSLDHERSNFRRLCRKLGVVLPSDRVD
ncbi:sigma-54-dependent Fis family transcriptional regulator [Candidatus Woesearchaeota archaeon]|nr:sigma-54-dependent Fis family transcriptional regulator [Candidatus Woesearchaeota archaeon]